MKLLYIEKILVNPFKRFELKKQYKDQGDEVMKKLVEMLMNSLYGEQITIDIVGKQVYKPENWLLNEYKERFKDGVLELENIELTQLKSKVKKAVMMN